jgi:dienelactone hydrolase
MIGFLRASGSNPAAYCYDQFNQKDALVVLMRVAGLHPAIRRLADRLVRAATNAPFFS